MKDRNSALNWLDRKMKSKLCFINGDDVKNLLKINGPEISNILNNVWVNQKQSKINNREEALKWLLENYS